jgi:hypothetical protein
MEEVISSRLLTFFVALSAAIVSAHVWPDKQKVNA